jgi:hypothetical protein
VRGHSAIRIPCLREAPPVKALCGGQALRRRQAKSNIASQDHYFFDDLDDLGGIIDRLKDFQIRG